MSGHEEQDDPRTRADYERLREMTENLAEAVANMSTPQVPSRGLVGSVKKVNSFLVGVAGLVGAVIVIYQAGKTAFKKLGIHINTKSVNKNVHSLQNEVVRQWHRLDYWQTHMAWWQIILIFIVGMISIHKSRYGESRRLAGLLYSLLIWVLWATTPTWGLALMIAIAALMVLWMRFY